MHNQLNESETRYNIVDPLLEKAGWNLADWRSVGFEIPVDGYDAEKKVTNQDTLKRQWAEFMDMCYKDAGGQLPAKNIVFAVIHNHALRLEEAFNEMYPEYKGLLASVITSRIERNKDLLKQFETESIPRIAISVYTDD